MKILDNSTRGLNPLQKHLLYRSCALPIMLYSFQLWFYYKASLSYPLKTLGKSQRRAVITLEPQSGFKGQTLILKIIQENSIESSLPK